MSIFGIRYREKEAHRTLKLAASRRALWELIWEQEHLKPHGTGDRSFQTQPMPHVSDYQIRQELKQIMRKL